MFRSIAKSIIEISKVQIYIPLPPTQKKHTHTCVCVCVQGSISMVWSYSDLIQLISELERSENDQARVQDSCALCFMSISGYFRDFVISLLSNSVRFPVIDQATRKNMYILSCIFTSEEWKETVFPETWQRKTDPFKMHVPWKNEMVMVDVHFICDSSQWWAGLWLASLPWT